jgi:hypothetical protein
MQAHDFAKCVKALVVAMLAATTAFACKFILRLMIDFVRDYLVNSTGSAMAWFSHSAETLLEYGWVILDDGASMFGDISSAYVAYSGVVLQGVINIIRKVSSAVGIDVTLGALELILLWRWRFRRLPDDNLILAASEHFSHVILKDKASGPLVVRMSLWECRL